MGRLSGKVAIITGASSGMGRATSIRFAGEGASIVVADLNQEGGEATVRECKENAGNAIFQKTDVSAEAEIKALVARAVKEFGRVDIMYNNAGIGGAVGPLEKISVEDWDRSQAVLLRGVFLGIKHSVPEMRKAGGGTILSNGSVAAIRAESNSPAYSAVKAAMVNLTASAAIQLAKDRIRVNCISPGVINTPTVWSRLPGGEAEAERLFANTQPIQRIGRSADVAAVAAFLCSDEAEWITGINLVVDGGATAGHYERPRARRSDV
jgi:NAD(P)-dependent dehydrogenase (short-subunit alcohol dehydrogenase family)